MACSHDAILYTLCWFQLLQLSATQLVSQTVRCAKVDGGVRLLRQLIEPLSATATLTVTIMEIAALTYPI